mgnify:CR=1 FL=1
MPSPHMRAYQPPATSLVRVLLQACGRGLLAVEIDQRLASEQMEQDSAERPDVSGRRVARLLDHVTLGVALGQCLGRGVLECAARLYMCMCMYACACGMCMHACA